MSRKLYDIADEIRREWKSVYFAARPYLSAMRLLSSVDDAYGADSARGIVRYFLANARTWRGPVARRVKDELREMLK